MTNDEERIQAIYDKTEGHCRYCGKRLSINNYGMRDATGGWVIDHSIPLSRGGTDHMNNLFPACYDCNEEKGELLGDSFLKRKKGMASSSTSDCFVATAACRPEDQWIIETLREWRDMNLLLTIPGRIFISFYYKLGPSFAELVRRSDAVRTLVRKSLCIFAQKIRQNIIKYPTTYIFKSYLSER
ncbi:MAG: HNH endonuclease signature motif containing protein [Thermoplasmata archaeon]